MKRTRKGFTLVELLIVITIIGVLAATLSVSASNATSAAKATSIIKNIEACKTAANLYFMDHNTEDLSDKTAAEFLKDGSKYVPNWKDFSEEGDIKYEIGTKGLGYGSWDVTVTFASSAANAKKADAVNLATALKGHKGYSVIEPGTTKSITVELSSGRVTAK